MINAVEVRLMCFEPRSIRIDILNVAQNRNTAQATAWNSEDVGKFAVAIAEAEAQVWLHCEPWHNPRTFGRVRTLS